MAFTQDIEVIINLIDDEPDQTSQQLVLKIELDEEEYEFEEGFSDMNEMGKVLACIGKHVSKEYSNEKLSQTLLKYALTCISLNIIPRCQSYLRNPQTGVGSINDSEINLVKNVIIENNIRYYTHSPFIINLCNPFTKKNPTSDKWVMGLLREDLINTSKIGGKGVVVHVGKYLKKNQRVALDIMEKYIRQTLPYATEECPLLLETAAGQGTELCVSIEDMSDFYDRFNDDDRRVFKICIDTCHVFSAGYDPLFFVTKWNRLHPNSIRLVHFNDSQTEKGSKVDRHAYFLNGNGHIGTDKLMEVAKWCCYHDVDMVTE